MPGKQNKNTNKTKQKSPTNPVCSVFNCWNLAVVLCDCWPDISICRAQQSPSALDLTAGTQSTNPLHPHGFLLLKSPLIIFFNLSKASFLCFPSVSRLSWATVDVPRKHRMIKVETLLKKYFSFHY